ncbi:serine/threonine-protein phosphatase 6 regulatory ankyrin repeat subunit A-like [Anoplophora glabripennis]|uniref:serine/threonine-protein phosphatase 6 regulatory ankyrin repeat subunit A-like n=1 Tax=Anoplophora glabripennis TaxID=217634 RepID=UPI000C76B734|nr:serine/threonine-protein phosphatase 6 regulatory ankyrin repeat subunit A-like [Anoplophora glabripennis]
MDRKVVLMFDGFDEIGPDYTQLILDLLRQCQNAPNYDKIFITSRPHVALELVTNLQVRSFTLEPFTKQDQVHFLASYWKHNLHLADTEKDKCERYAVALINRVFYWIEQHQSGENHFAAVPLQIRMLAEIFQESDRFEEALEWQRCKEFLVSNEAEPKLPENMNIMRLYQMFVDKKRNIFMDKGNPTGNTVANHALIDQFEECIAYQRTLALEVILDKTKCELFSCYRESRRNVEINMLNIGIVQKLDNEFHFIHRTFAEYFVAESLLKELQTQNDDLKFQTYLIEEILLAPQFNVTRVFLNGFLQPVVDDLPSRTFQRYQSISYKINLSNRKLGLLHELAGEGHVAIFQLILKCIDIVKDIPVISTHGIDTPTGNTPEHTVYGNILNIMLNRVQREGLDMTDGFKTLLEYAAENGHLEMVKFLVQRGANVNIGVCKPLHLAVQAGHIEVSKFLIEQGADIKSLDFLDDSSVLYKAVRKNDVATATYLLNEMWKTDDLNINVSNNIAHTAACLGNIDILKNLVGRGVDVNNRVEYGETPFFGAVRGGQLETIKYLVQRGCDINSEDHRNRTALHIIAPNPSDVSTAKFLIDLGIDVNVISSDMKTALHLALEGANYDLIESLVNSGADVDLEDEKGATALHLAASKYQQLAVKLLVEHGANLNKRDKWGRTPLHVVILNDFSIFDSYGYPNCIPNIVFSKDRLEITKFIIENGADLNTRDIKGRTAFHLGAISGQSDIVMLLMQFEVDANIRDNDGRAAVHLATLGGHTDIVKFLVLHNVDITIKDNSGYTILQYLSFCRDQLDILKLIKAHTGDVNVEDGCSALHSAVERGDLDTVIFLVETGIDVNIRDKEGNTALHLAINKGHFSIVEYLVKIGVDITVQDNYGYTALHLAVKSSDSDMSFRRDNNDPALQSPAHVNDSDGAKIRKNTEVHICDRINTESLFEKSETDISMSLNVLDNQLSAVLRYVKDNQPDLNSISEKLEALNSSTLEALKSIGDTTKKIKSVLIPSSDERGTHIKDNNITTLPLALQEASLNFEKVFTAIRANKVHDSGNVPFFAKFCTGTNSKSNDTMSLPSVIDNGSSSTFKFPGNTGKSFSVRDNKCMVLPFTPKLNDTKPDVLENRTITETKERICYMDIIAMLVLQCDEVLDMRDKNGHTPLHLAILKGNLEVVNFLVKHKADVNVTDNSGRTSLQLAAKNGNLDIVKLLIDHGVDVNNQGNDGWTALLTAVWEGQLNTVKFLITECNADMNTIDKDGRTAVHLAASEGHLETLVFLLQCGMDAEVRDNDGRTAIHLAALGSPSYLPRFFGLSGEAKHKVYLSVVNLLMKQGVDVNSKDTNGNTAAFLAEREGHLEMAKYLEASVCSGISRN